VLAVDPSTGLANGGAKRGRFAAGDPQRRVRRPLGHHDSLLRDRRDAFQEKPDPGFPVAANPGLRCEGVAARTPSRPLSLRVQCKLSSTRSSGPEVTSRVLGSQVLIEINDVIDR
jgi:hypothetical protein